MFAIGFYLVTLIMAPQLWLGPLVNLPTDFIAIPLLFITVVLSGRLAQLLRFSIHDGLFLLFVIWMAAGAVLSNLTPESTAHLVNYFKWFILFKLVVALLPDPRAARRMMGFIVFLVTVLAVEVMFHRFSPDGRGWAGQTFSWIDPEVLAAGGKGRARWVGIFDGPGVFAVLFSIALPFLIIKLGRGYTGATRLFALLLTALYMVAIYFIGSRGGLLATAATLGIFIALKSGVSIKHLVMFGSVVALLFSAAPSHLTTVRDSSNSTQYRVEMWAQGLDMVKQDPAFGIGRGNFRAYTSKLIAHNSAVEIGGEMGMVGLFIWFGMIYFAIKSLVLAWRRTEDPKERDFYVAMILSILGYLISAMFVTLEYETWYLLLAVCAAVGRYQPEPVRAEKRDLMFIGGGVVGFLVMMQVFVIFYLG
ncbi:MAG TPA: O-antigen ligase family protein [Steroidobacteraceae bacterium]|nr:O-antigen ligase family protein [Steroidobacteraceae bacterium]